MLRRAGPVAVALVLLGAAAGCGPGDEDHEPGVAGVDSRSLPEAIAAAGALSGLLTKPNGAESCGLRPDGEAECWGARSNQPLYGPEGVFTAITRGLGYGCGVRVSGRVDCWGDDDRNLYGEMDPPDGVFTAVSAWESRTCGMRRDGSAECWGGVRELLAGFEPPAPEVAFPGGAFTAISVGGAHVCGLRPDGEVACWGVNWFGQADPPPGGFVAVDAGESHSCGLRANGSVECWGEDSRDAAVLMSVGFEYGGDEAAYVADERDVDWSERVVFPSSVALLDLQGAVPEAEVREEMARRAVGWEPPGGPFVAVSAGDGFT